MHPWLVWLLEGGCHTSHLLVTWWLTMAACPVCALQALRALHAHGVAHGDIRLPNIIVQRDTGKVGEAAQPTGAVRRARMCMPPRHTCYVLHLLALRAC